ncbi:acyl-CoA dehydrogenase, partial [Bacillus sp. NRRL B-14911]
MDFSYSGRVKDLQDKLTEFMERHVYPAEYLYEKQLNEQDSRWSGVPQIMEELKEKAKAEGLWNLFLPDSE